MGCASLNEGRLLLSLTVYYVQHKEEGLVCLSVTRLWRGAVIQEEEVVHVSVWTHWLILSTNVHTWTGGRLCHSFESHLRKSLPFPSAMLMSATHVHTGLHLLLPAAFPNFL